MTWFEEVVKCVAGKIPGISHLNGLLNHIVKSTCTPSVISGQGHPVQCAGNAGRACCAESVLPPTAVMLFFQSVDVLIF
jgi:hypothetical protein